MRGSGARFWGGGWGRVFPPSIAREHRAQRENVVVVVVVLVVVKKEDVMVVVVVVSKKECQRYLKIPGAIHVYIMYVCIFLIPKASGVDLGGMMIVSKKLNGPCLVRDTVQLV